MNEYFKDKNVVSIVYFCRALRYFFLGRIMEDVKNVYFLKRIKAFPRFREYFSLPSSSDLSAISFINNEMKSKLVRVCEKEKHMP